jgi:hypothetical protein
MKNRHGFTIIEAIFSISILAIVIVILCVFIRASLKSWLAGQPLVDAQTISREIVSGKGNWRGMEGELRELYCILNANPENISNFYLRSDKIRFIGPISIVKGEDNICSTLAHTDSDDIQLIGAGTVNIGTDTIISGADGILQSIPGDINGDGILTADERQESDDYACGRLMAGGKDAVIIMGVDTSNLLCATQKCGDDEQIVPLGHTAGAGAVLITPGENGILESVPGDFNGDGDNEDDEDGQNTNNFISSAVISYEFLPGTNTIIRKINEKAPDSARHLGPSIIAKNVTDFKITYYETDGVTTIPYGSVTLAHINSIGLIEIQGTVSVRKKGYIGKGTATATFKTKIQPRALNPIYRRQ